MILIYKTDVHHSYHSRDVIGVTSDQHYQIELDHLEELTGNIESENKAYQFLEILINDLAHHLVRKLPEDKTNRWGIE